MNRNALAQKRKTHRKLVASEKAQKIAVRRVLRQKAKHLAQAGGMMAQAATILAGMSIL